MGGGNQTREDDVKEQVANDVLIHGGFNTYCVSNVLNCFKFCDIVKACNVFNVLSMSLFYCLE